jgi:polysaccharide biosynthesis/export protein
MKLRYSVLNPVFLSVCVAALVSGADEKNSPASGQVQPEVRALYRLGPGDEIKVQQANAEELDGKTARIDDKGYANLPLAGRVQLSGLTLEEAETTIALRLSRLLLNPQPVLSITEYRSQPVSVLGAVNTPGVIQLQGRKTLVEMLSLAGGPRPDAGTTVQVTRRLTNGNLPLKNASPDPSNQYSIANVDLSALLKGNNPADNIVVLPQDIISVPRAEMLYVIGDVRKPGGYPLNTNGALSVLQAVSMAEGLAPSASPRNAKIFRPRADSPGGTEKDEIPVDVAAILQGKKADVQLKPQDILFVPDSASKKAGVRAAEAILQAATGVVIYRH